MAARENNHGDLGATLSAYLDGELSPAQEAKVEKQLTKDAEARELLAELRETSQMVGSVPQAKAPRGMAERIQLELERDLLLGDTTTIGATEGERHLRMRRLLAAAALVALAVGIVTMGYRVLSRPEHVGPDDMQAREKPTVEITKVVAVDDAGGGEAKPVAMEMISLEDIVLPELQRGSVHLVAYTEDLAASRALIEAFFQEYELDQVIHTQLAEGEEQYALLCSALAFVDLFDVVSQWPGGPVDAVVEHKVWEDETVVPDVTEEQVLRLATAESATERVALARRFRLVNTPAAIVANERVGKTERNGVGTREPFFFESPFETIAKLETPHSRAELLVLSDPELMHLRALGPGAAEANSPLVPLDVLEALNGRHGHSPSYRLSKVEVPVSEFSDEELDEMLVAVVLELRTVENPEDVISVGGVEISTDEPNSF